jgi:protein-disulfide isomerase
VTPFHVPSAAKSLVARHPRMTFAAVAGVGVLVSWILQLSPPPAQRLQSTPVVQAVLTDRGSPAVGPAGADVTIVVFTDYLCAICRGADPALDRVRAADPKLRVVYKDWPLFGERSRFASRVALAAARQGRYLEVHNALMRARGSLDAQAVVAAAVGAGADGSRLEADLQLHRPEIDAQLARHAFQAWSLGLEGTPAYLVGPFLIRGAMTEGPLRRAVSHARRETSLTQRSLAAAGAVAREPVGG